MAFKIACLVHQSVAVTNKRTLLLLLLLLLLASKASTYLTADIRLVCEHGRRSIRSSSNRTLAVPRTRGSFDDRSFAAAGPHLWSSLPTNLRQMTSYGQFRRHLKAHFIWEVFSKSERIVTMISCSIEVHLPYLLKVFGKYMNESIYLLDIQITISARSATRSSFR